MKYIVLNMMILGMVTCLVGEDVFAKDISQQVRLSSRNLAHKKSQLSKNNKVITITDKSEEKFKKINDRVRREEKIDRDFENDSRNTEQIQEQSEELTEVSESLKTKKSSVPPIPAVQEGKASIPPPPPPPISGNVPPPPPMMGMQLPTYAQAKKVNVSDVMQELREQLDEFLDSNGVKTMANVVNLYLQGNREKISEGISVAEASMVRLNNRLNNDLDELTKVAKSNPGIEEFSGILQNLPDLLQKLNKKSYQANDRDKAKTFEKISQEINKIAHAYFQKVMKSGEILKTIPNLTALKDAEIVLERAVVLADSFSDLINLSEQPRNEEFSERATRDVISIINLKRFISDKLKDSSTSSTNFIALPTGGDPIPEGEYLGKALQYIDNTCKGNNQLQKLLDMRDVLNNKYTTITSNDQTNSKDPLMIIRQLDDRISGIGNLLKQASRDSNNSKYTQFGKMFTEGDTGYGGALISSVNQWIDSENFAEFSNDKIRNAFKGKDLTGDVVAEYITLLTDDMNLCKSFAKSVINRIVSQTKFKSSSFASASKKTETKKEDQKVLLEITNGKAKLGTSSDPQKDKNLIPFSMLKKNCEGYVKEISAVDKDMKEIPEILEKIRKSFSREIDNDQLATYVNSVINSYFVFREFTPQDDQVSFSVVNTEKGLLSTADVPNAVFALAQNCNLAVKQPALPLFPTSKDTNNTWVFKMALDLHMVISKLIKTIHGVNAEVFSERSKITETKVGEIVTKLNNLNKLIEEAIYQDVVIKQVAQNLKAEISATEKQAAKIKSGKIIDQLLHLQKSVNDITDQYTENNHIDDESFSVAINELQDIQSDINKIIRSGKIEADEEKSELPVGRKQRRRNDEFIR